MHAEMPVEMTPQQLCHVPPKLAVIIPVHKQGSLLAEALDSVLAQQAEFALVAILVNDGCPYQETHEVCRDFALAYPGRIIYLRQENGGLSSARNTGIEYVLRNAPSVEAMFFLDADNRLLPTAMSSAFAELRRHPEASWIYPSIDMFGLRDAYDYAGPYSVVRHLNENLCEAGSLVHRKIFEAGVRFDESMKSGYEDWDFWLSAAEKGFRGYCFPEFGFGYRRRPESMVSNSYRAHSAIRAYMRRKHDRLFRAPFLLREEHESAGRYVVYLRDSDRYMQLTDPAIDVKDLEIRDIERLLWQGICEPARTPVPGFLVATTGVFLSLLRRTRLAAWAFWTLEGRLGESDVAAFECRQGQPKDRIQIADRDVQRSGSKNADLPLAMMPWHLLEACAKDTSTRWFDSILSESTEMRISVTEVTLPRRSSFGYLAPREMGYDNAFESLQMTVSKLHQSRYRNGSITQWTWRNVSEKRRQPLTLTVRELTEISFPVFPHVQKRGREQKNVAFLIPVLAFGGVEKVTLAIAAELKTLGWIPHLVVAEVSEAALPPSVFELFETISFLCQRPQWNPGIRYFGTSVTTWSNPSSEHSMHRMLGLLSAFDVVINAHAIELNAVMGALKQRGVMTISHQHLIDRTPAGAPCGHPYLAIAYEHAYDAIMCCSSAMSNWLSGMGVPAEKLLVVENSPSFPISEHHCDQTLAERARRGSGNPLRILVMGRLDRQKGLHRVEELRARLIEQKVPAEFRIVGARVIDNAADIQLPREMLLPPALSSREVIGHLQWADVLLVLSSWEGLPLTILEAMPFGAVPVCTDVGAVREVVEHGVNGIIVPLESAVTDALTILSRLQADRGMILKLATAASAAGRGRSWRTAVKPLVSMLERLDSLKGRQ